MFRGIFRISYLPERSRLVPVLAVSGNGVISEVCNVWKKNSETCPRGVARENVTYSKIIVTEMQPYVTHHQPSVTII